jgi:hypothetical protein
MYDIMHTRVLADCRSPTVVRSYSCRQGFDRFGFSREGYDKDGFDRFGYDKAGYDKAGFGEHAVATYAL